MKTNLAVSNGESNREYQERGLMFLKKLRQSYTPGDVAIIVSHGNFITSLFNLSSGNPFFSFDQMMALSNPDVFMLKLSDVNEKILASYQRIWDVSKGLDIRTRVSARAIILDQSMSKILLFHLQDKSLIFNGVPQTRPLWITPGGEVEPGEDLQVSLERELEEELGLKPEDYILKGHLWRSENKRMVFKMRPCRVVDNYFLVQIRDNEISFDFSKWTEDEKIVLTKLKWWNLDDISTTDDKVVPVDLRSLSKHIKEPVEFSLIVEHD